MLKSTLIMLTHFFFALKNNFGLKSTSFILSNYYEILTKFPLYLKYLELSIITSKIIF